MCNKMYKEHEIITGTDGKKFIISKYSGELSCFECVFSVRHNPNFDNSYSCQERRMKYLNKTCSCIRLLPYGFTFKDFFKEFKEGI